MILCQMPCLVCGSLRWANQIEMRPRCIDPCQPPPSSAMTTIPTIDDLIGMPCLSLHQPWASLLAHGMKRVETRSWRIAQKFLNRPLLIHAAARWTTELQKISTEWPFADKLREAGLITPGGSGSLNRQIPFGAVVGCVTVTECILTQDAKTRWSVYEDGAAEKYAEEVALGDYSRDRWAWICTGFTAFVTPVPLRGFQGVFTVKKTHKDKL